MMKHRIYYLNNITDKPLAGLMRREYQNKENRAETGYSIIDTNKNQKIIRKYKILYSNLLVILKEIV